MSAGLSMCAWKVRKNEQMKGVKIGTKGGNWRRKDDRRLRGRKERTEGGGCPLCTPLKVDGMYLEGRNKAKEYTSRKARSQEGEKIRRQEGKKARRQDGKMAKWQDGTKARRH